MKIKTVCDITGLTDRTIRYYIEEQLISPAYTENYLGRKSFDFSQEDIDALKNISVLRKFDFTIDEIRQIIVDANSSTAIILNVMQRTEKIVSVGEEKLQVLSKLNNERTYTLKELAAELSMPKICLPENHEIIKRNLKNTIRSLAKSLFNFIIVWSPIILSLLNIIDSISIYYYPVIEFTAVILVLISYLPSVCILFVSKSKWKLKKIVQRALLILCALSIPFSFLMSFGVILGSETTDIRNYREFDALCPVNRRPFFQDLFPIWAHYFTNEKQPDGSWEDVYLDAHYYYRNKPAFDYTYDVYAQWPLEEDDFHKEVTRVRELFESDRPDYVTIQKGNYTCFFAYSGAPPFEEVSNSYTYYIFAYDETNLVVRYIVCDSLENGADQPYYLSLEW